MSAFSHCLAAAGVMRRRGGAVFATTGFGSSSSSMMTTAGTVRIRRSSLSFLLNHHGRHFGGSTATTTSTAAVLSDGRSFRGIGGAFFHAPNCRRHFWRSCCQRHRPQHVLSWSSSSSSLSSRRYASTATETKSLSRRDATEQTTTSESYNSAAERRFYNTTSSEGLFGGASFLPLGRRGRSSSSSRFLLPLLRLAARKVPKGFEDFFPGDTTNNGDDRRTKGGAHDDDADDAVGDDAGVHKRHKKKKKAASASGDEDHDGSSGTSRVSSSGKKRKGDRKQQQQQQQSPPPPPPLDDSANLPGLLALLAVVIAARSFLDPDAESAAADTALGREITYVDFRNKFLNTRKVEKLEVVNGKLARVILKPDAILDDMDAAAAATGSGSGASTSHGGVVVGGHDSLFQTAGVDASTNDGMTMASQQQQARSRGAGAGAGRAHYYFYIGSVESLEDRLTRAQAHLHPTEWVEIQYVTRTNWSLELMKYLPTAAFVAAIYFGSRGIGAGIPGAGGSSGAGGRGGGGSGGMGSIFSIGRSTARKITPEDVQVGFSDVAGCDEAKREVMEFVDFLKDSERFTKLGAKIPKGALLCGPPGTGKTLLAKAVAGEAGVPFYSISGSDFIEMFVGVGPSRVRDLFKEARSSAPCIVFIDEIDAVGRRRGRGGFSGGGNDERENTLNQLLVEMDGFSPTTGVVVLAGTNRVDILDQALTRPGRFDRQIQVDRPDLAGRKQIFKVHLRGITLDRGELGHDDDDGNDDDDAAEDEAEDDDGDYYDEEEEECEVTDAFAGRLAGLTPGFAGADVANLCNEAAIVAARRKAAAVSMSDFEEAVDRILGGLESGKIMSRQERSIVAHHEAGHAVAGWFLEHADPLLKVTIIPRASGALGFAQYLPKEVFLRSREQIMDLVCMALAGRAAEDVFFDGQVTTGASDDLRRVTQLVYSTIKDFGMNERLGQLAFPENDQQQSGLGEAKPYSDSTAEAMDEEARAIVEAAYRRTVELVREHREDIDKVAALLLEKETVTHDDLVDLIGPRPFQGDKAYQEYVSNRHSSHTEEEGSGDSKNAKEDEAAIDNGNLTPGLA